MIFTQFKFILFFAITYYVHWLLSDFRHRKIFLLIVSYVFYGAWDWRFLSLIFISTAVDYTIGLLLKNSKQLNIRKVFLTISLITNLGILGFFKYFNFFIDSTQNFLFWLGLPTSIQSLQIILPVGISFYTFQTLSYTIDVYRGHLRPEKSLLNFALFVSFFPQLVAGPIVRAIDFLPQLQKPRHFSRVDIRACLSLFMIGFFKKACISDNIAPVIDLVFEQPDVYNSPSICLAVLLYAVQIYCDFSGYSDMAIACAGLLDYRLCLNFSHPYFSPNITEFWRRWHISLSTWLRDYLYIPLGGNRGTPWRIYLNIMITMVIGGLWHGAAWRFIVWGTLHGCALVSHKILHQRYLYRFAKGAYSRLFSVLGTMLTFCWVCLAWIFFRANNLGKALEILQGLVLFNSPGQQSISLIYWFFLIILIIAHWLTFRQFFKDWWKPLPNIIFASFYGVLCAVILVLKPMNYQPFIYFQF